MSKKLAEIRNTIDTLDNQIHDLLMKRAELIIDICEEKRKSNRPVVQPAREAMMIRRLLTRHEGVLPQAAIVGIWRELVGAVCLLQKGLHVHVVSGAGLDYCWDAAKDYFGSVLPMTRTASAFQAISAVREDDSNIAVVPWPQDTNDDPWWLNLLHQESETVRKMRIVCALPYGSRNALSLTAEKSLVVAKIDYAPSGEDHSFIAVESPHNISRSRVVDILKAQNLNVIGISAREKQAGLEASAYLAEVDDFVAEDDDRLKQVEKAGADQALRCIAIGGYPVPPVFPEGDTDPVSVPNVQSGEKQSA